jgi:small-conductance mechanosensitive channel
MLHALSFDRVEQLLGTTPGRWQVAVVLACFAVAFAVDRLVTRGPGVQRDAATGLQVGVVRGVFPITALLLLLAARAVFRKHGDTIFFDVAIPLAIALAGIRVLVYTLRRVFAQSAWVARSERAIGFTIWGALVLYYLGVGSEIVAWLESVQIPIGRNKLSLASMLEGLIVVVITLSVALWFAGFLERRLMRTEFNPNVRAVTSKLLRAFLVFIAVLFALQAVGFDLTLLSVFGGALGVGIGLGLQRLAANYIAGFAILLDKSVQLGDVITVDNRFGRVTEVTSRYVVLSGLDGVKSIVPNETLIANTVLNHSHNRTTVRVPIVVQVDYKSDVERALAILVEATADEPRVLRQPGFEPAAFLSSLGESGLTLELGVWIDDPENGQLALRSAILRRVLAAYAEAGIRIPYPRREIQVVGREPDGAGLGGETSGNATGSTNR